MKPARAPRLGSLRSFAELAKVWGKSYWSTRRLLRRIAYADGPKCSWLIIINGRLFVNLSALKVSHPALFEKRWHTKEEIDDLVEKVQRLSERLSEEMMARKALGARVRALEGARR